MVLLYVKMDGLESLVIKNTVLVIALNMDNAIMEYATVSKDGLDQDVNFINVLIYVILEEFVYIQENVIA